MTGIDENPGGTVVSTAFESKSYASLKIIEGYWESVRKGRLVPNRFEVDPRGLSGALSNAFILERISGGLARFRIAGSLITETAGAELRGVPMSALFNGESRDELADAINAAFDDPVDHTPQSVFCGKHRATGDGWEYDFAAFKK